MKPEKPLPILRLVIDILLLAVLLTVFVLVTPSVRAQVETWLGIRQDSNGITIPSPLLITIEPSKTAASVAVTPVRPGVTPPEATATPNVSAIFPTVVVQNATEIARIADQSGWMPLRPDWLPGDYQPGSAIFDSKNNLVTLTFNITRTLPDGGGNTETKAINLVQGQTNTGIPLQLPPANAAQEVVQVGGTQAVFAFGGWDSEFIPDKTEAGGGHFAATWNSDAQAQNIFWQVDSIYLVLVSDDLQLSKEDLIQLAASVH
jgi:hypothetical protein